MKLTVILSTFLIFILKVEYSLQKLEVRVENYCLFQASHLPVRLKSPALGLLANCFAPKSLQKMFGIEIQHRNRAPTNQGIRTSAPEIARGFPARAREGQAIRSLGEVRLLFVRDFAHRLPYIWCGYSSRWMHCLIGQQVAEVTW